MRVTVSRKIEIDKQVLEPKKLEGKELAQKQNIYSRTVVKVSIAGRIKTKIRNLFYKVNKKRWSVIPILFALLFSFNSSAEEAIFNEKDFFIKLSTDNNIISSQNAPTNVAFSAISGLAYLTDKFDLSKNPFYRFGLGYSTIMITILNHELSGHGFRALEFGSKITKLEINPIKFSGALSFSISPFNSHRQKQTMISLGGMQASYLLSQKIADHLVFRNQKIDFITGIGYFFSAFDQINYNYMNNDVASDKGWRSKESCIEKIRNYSNGHDVQSYSIFMQEMYGDGSITMNTMKFHGLLSLLDPILFASIYSFTLHKSVDVPMLNIGKIGIIPFARSVFAPYGTIEKKFGSYILTDYTPIKVGFSVGKQFKTATPRLNNLDRSCLYSHLDTFCSDYSLSCDSESSIGIFTGLEKDEIVEQHMTYSFDISVFKLLNFDKLNIGANAVFWRQPELFVKDPYRAKPKNGFMLMLNASYKTSDKLNVLFDVGYKTKGFIPGQHLGETSIINLALEYKM